MSTTAPRTTGGVGERLPRSDGRAKVTGEFAYSSDLHVEGMLFGVTLRSPHPSARIRGIDTSAALAARGVRAVLTHEDVPGEKLIGSVLPDQPVLAIDRVRHHGEPIALVAADDPDAARAAAASIAVDYEVEEPVVDPVAALDAGRDAGPRRRQRPAHGPHPPRGPGRDRAGRGPRHVRRRSPGPGVPRPGVRARGARRAGRDRPAHRDAVPARRPRPGGGGTRARARSGPARPGRASAARSARARTSRCSCTRACSPSRPGVP